MTINITTQDIIYLNTHGESPYIEYRKKRYPFPSKDKDLVIEIDPEYPIVAGVGLIRYSHYIDQVHANYKLSISPWLSYMFPVTFGLLFGFILVTSLKKIDTTYLFIFFVVYVILFMGYFFWLSKGNHIKITAIKNP